LFFSDRFSAFRSGVVCVGALAQQQLWKRREWRGDSFLARQEWLADGSGLPWQHDSLDSAGFVQQQGITADTTGLAATASRVIAATIVLTDLITSILGLAGKESKSQFWSLPRND
jgi:hypothetical protein